MSRLKKLDPKEVTDDSIRSLAAAICIQAAADYRRSLRGKWGGVIGRENGHYIYGPYEGGNTFLLHNKKGWHPAIKEGIKPPQEYNDFFMSGWFEELSGIEDGRKVIMFLRSVRGRNINFSW